MASHSQVSRVLNLLGEHLACPLDETRLRFGDFECPHCGADLEEHLYRFAQRLVEAVEGAGTPGGSQPRATGDATAIGNFPGDSPGRFGHQPQSPDATLRELQDRSAINQLMARYYHCVDRRDFKGVGTAFTEDASVDFATGTPIRGRDAIVEFITGVGRYPVTTHFMGNQTIGFNGDTADVETYAIAFQRGKIDGKDLDMAIGIRYLDRMVRRGGGWLVASRVMVYDWRRYDPVFPPPAR